jgi:hypothetical protein
MTILFALPHSRLPLYPLVGSIDRQSVRYTLSETLFLHADKVLLALRGWITVRKTNAIMPEMASDG